VPVVPTDRRIEVVTAVEVRLGGVARWMTAGYGALAFLGLLAVGFVTQYVTVPVQDPATGRIIDETVNLRPILLVAAISRGGEPRVDSVRPGVRVCAADVTFCTPAVEVLTAVSAPRR
jgi:hypothetical protein